jgi:AAA+ ATPase superfamily predicted ATPase
VVREQRMHYYRVPKLGSYLAIRLEYNSCQLESALDSAVQDYLDMRHRMKE